MSTGGVRHAEKGQFSDEGKRERANYPVFVAKEKTNSAKTRERRKLFHHWKEIRNAHFVVMI